MKYAFVVFALIAFTAIAETDFLQAEVEDWGTQQVAGGLRTAGGFVGSMAGPINSAGNTIKTLPNINAGKVQINTQNVGNALNTVSKFAGAAGQGLNWAGSQIGGGRDVDEVEDWGTQQVAGGLRTAGGFVGSLSGPINSAGNAIKTLPNINAGKVQINTQNVGNALNGVSKFAGAAGQGLNWAGNQIGRGRDVEVEDLSLPNHQQVAGGLRIAGGVAGQISGPLSTGGSILNTLPPIQVGPVNTRVVGAGLSVAGTAAGVASKGLNWAGNQVGRGRVEVEDAEVEDWSAQQVAGGLRTAGGVVQKVTPLLSVGNAVGKGLSWAGNQLGRGQ